MGQLIELFLQYLDSRLDFSLPWDENQHLLAVVQFFRELQYFVDDSAFLDGYLLNLVPFGLHLKACHLQIGLCEQLSDLLIDGS